MSMIAHYKFQSSPVTYQAIDSQHTLLLEETLVTIIFMLDNIRVYELPFYAPGMNYTTFIQEVR